MGLGSVSVTINNRVFISPVLGIFTPNVVLILFMF